MALYAVSSTAGVGDGPFLELSREACERLDGCEAQKREFDLDIRESYFFAAPHRAREIRSAQAISPTKPTDSGDLQIGLAMELAKDFTTVVVNAFMPPAEPWAEQRPGMFVPDDVKEEIKQAVRDQDPKIFNAIRASNMYEELPKAANPDLAIGTMALWIDNPRPAENIVVQAVPLHEVEINIGPYGSLDDRFIVRHTKHRHVKALLREVYDDLDAEMREKIEDPKNRNQACIIRWGYWRLWDEMGDVVWQHVVMLDKKVIHEARLHGEGSCPFIVMRFNPSPEWAFGSGPLIETLPEFRQLDDLATKMIEHIDAEIAPAMGYPDESIASIEGGVKSGTFYPIRPGTENSIKRLMEPGKIEPAIYETKERERSLRHRFFLDWPEQRGDTPPTATQWLDEMQLAQRRLGTPGSSFWKEGPAQIFLRFKHILEKNFVIEPIKVNGKTVSLEPYNPAQRAAEQQEVAMFARFAQIAAPLFPEEWRLETDGGKSLKAIAEKMRVTGLWKQRSAQDKQAALGMISQLIEGRQQVRPADAGVAGSL